MLRRKGDDELFVLKQEELILMLQNIWGADATDATSHHNDRVCLFGIIMLLPQYSDNYQKLVEGVTSRHALDSPELHLP